MTLFVGRGIVILFGMLAAPVFAASAVNQLNSIGEGVEAEAAKGKDEPKNAANANGTVVQAETVDSAKAANANAVGAQSATPDATGTASEAKVPKPEDFMRPASDMSGSQVIDIQNQMKKITEPNLFAGAAPNPGTLRNLASGEAPEEYLVKEGDTLFDICDQLVDEADYWPKLWSFNPTIENPHFVYPGMRLRFYPGDDKSPPFLQVITEDDILPVAKGDLVESELVREDISGMLMRSEIPDPAKVIDPKELDALLRVDNLFVNVGGTFNPSGNPVIVPAFIVKDEIPELGAVIGGSAGSFLVDRGQQVIMKDKDGLEVGTTYSIVRKSHEVRNSKGDSIGLRYEFVAQVRITLEDSEADGVFKGDVIFNRLGVQPDDVIVAYRSVRRVVPNKVAPDAKGIEQEVVDFTEPQSELGGRGSFVFVDQSAGKLQEKHTYRIVQNVRVAAAKFLKDDLPNTDSRVANVYILDSSGSAALGFLTEDSFEVRLGDRISR